VIQSLLATLRVELRGVVTTLICAAVAASAALVGVLFIAVAIFIWAADNYGRMQAIYETYFSGRIKKILNGKTL